MLRAVAMLGEVKEALDTNQVLVENANAETENFALLFEFDEDVKKIRHVLYHCSAARSNIESQTNEEEIEVQTEALAITASPLANGYVKAQTGDATTEAVYKDWYKNVYLPPKDNGSSDTPAPANVPANNRMVRSGSAPDVVSAGDGKNKA